MLWRSGRCTPGTPAEARKRAPLMSHTKQAACVYGPDGRCVGQLEPSRLYHLQSVQRHNPDVCARLESGSFEEEVYKLVWCGTNAAAWPTCRLKYRNWAVLEDVI